MSPPASSSPPAPPAVYRQALGAFRRRTREGRLFHALEFDAPEMERAYRLGRLRGLLPLLCVGQAVSLVGVVLFFVLDALVWGRYESPWVWGPLLGLYGPASLVVLALSFAPVQAAWRWCFRLFPVAGLACTLAVGLATGGALRQGLPPLYEAVMAQQLYVTCLMCLTFRRAWPVALAGAVLFIAVQAVVGGARDERILHDAAFLTASVVGLVLAWLAERNARLAWLRARRLAELERANDSPGRDP